VTRPDTDATRSTPDATRSRSLAALALAALVVVSGCAAVGDVVGSTDSAWFQDVAEERGLEYTTTGENSGNGDGGVYATDFDRDDRTDVLVTGGEGPALFRNAGGEFERADALPETDLTEIKGALFFDHDNDGWEDLLLVPRDDEMVFLENTGGQFEREEVGLETHLEWGTGASAADYDGDGCLDVFVIQNGDWQAGVPKRTHSDSFEEEDNGNPNLLFRGTCGSFERVDGAGVSEKKRWSLATSFVDLTGDGRPDIHVANDFNYDSLYVNRGNGTFERRDLPNTNRHGMASDVVDANGDGRLDIFVTNIEWEDTGGIWELRNGLDIKNRGNNLLINRGDGTFEDRATEYGVRVTGGWGWAGHLVDFDNDADLDLLHTTKYYLVSEGGELFKPKKPTPTAWERTGPKTFEPRNASDLGLESSDGRGMAVLDYDADGDQDFVIADTTDPFKLYENRRADRSGGHWLRVRVAGTPRQTPIGSELHVRTDNGTQFAVYNSRANFFSQDARPVHFGLAGDDAVDLRVVWPDGTERTFPDVQADGLVVVSRDGSIERVDRG
jgi:hypothetical protein